MPSHTAVAPVLDPEQRQTVLELVRSGRNRAEAALAVGLTGTKLRQLIGRDEELRQAYEEARAEGRHAFADELLSEMRRRLLVDKTGTDRLLAMALETYDADWAAARAARLAGREQEGDLLSAPPMISVDNLTDAEMEELERCVARVHELARLARERTARPAGEVEAA